MARYFPPEGEVISRHRFTRPAIRLWLPVLMVGLLLLCGWILAPRFSPIDVLALLFLAYVAISAVVTVVEITVVPEGLIIHRMVLPQRFVPWSAIDRTVVFAYEDGATGMRIEIASIGLYEGLSPLNRLPGPVYGQGWRQTIVITPDALEDYSLLLQALEHHCSVFRRAADR
jgi:hypothetical protein